MTDNEIYQSMIQRRELAYRDDQIIDSSYYNDPIDHSPGRLAGNSRIAGDASPEVQSRVIDAIVSASERGGLTPHQTAYVLAIARVESGFNPDAAAGTTTAYGLGQFVDRTAASYGIDDSNRGDITKQAEALVAHYKDNAAIASSRGKGEEYIYKYHHDGPASEYGGLALSRKHVMPYVDAYEKFVLDHQKSHGVTPFDPAFDARNHAAPPASARQHGDGGVLRQGARGDAVGELQTQLNQLGYSDLHGRSLQVDHHFGPGTKAAVESFQQANDLMPDGIVGPATTRQIHARLEEQASTQAQNTQQSPARLDDPSHPGNALYLQAREHVFRLDTQQGRTPDQYSHNLAAALTAAAQAEGLQRIDQVALSDNASRAWAVQRPPGVRDHFFDRHASVDTAQAVNTSVEQSSAAWEWAIQQQSVQAQSQVQNQAQGQNQQIEPAGPAMQIRQ
ncbi:Transglycosylase SLT domain-containing protein [Dyella sp. OK004]|uniref:phage tail tip lysozyme n=1 Tax=Dyella sp. OK004 TaxID=1855292 RepID=UPI0008F3F7F8|nr:XVIPCD domain-containing protein [Dyella sp. OK004]SFS03780.1 Transglycosylase SLT domain-containing protein [Dyella sp. OK004]